MATQNKRLVCYPSDEKLKPKVQAFCKDKRLSESQMIEYSVIAFMEYEENPINKIIGSTGPRFWDHKVKETLKK